MQNTPGLDLRDDTFHHSSQLIDDTFVVFIVAAASKRFVKDLH